MEMSACGEKPAYKKKKKIKEVESIETLVQFRENFPQSSPYVRKYEMLNR